MKKTLFVYGTLKKGCYNNFLLHDTPLLKKYSISCFKMYDMGFFPCIVYTGNLKDIVCGELYEVDEYFYKQISLMELAAGYSETEISVNIGDTCIEILTNAIVFTYKNIDGKLYKEIPNGIWNDKLLK